MNFELLEKVLEVSDFTMISDELAQPILREVKELESRLPLQLLKDYPDADKIFVEQLLERVKQVSLAIERCTSKPQEAVPKKSGPKKK